MRSSSGSVSLCLFRSRSIMYTVSVGRSTVCVCVCVDSLGACDGYSSHFIHVCTVVSVTTRQPQLNSTFYPHAINTSSTNSTPKAHSAHLATAATGLPKPSIAHINLELQLLQAGGENTELHSALHHWAHLQLR